MFIFDLFESSKRRKKSEQPQTEQPSLYKDSDDPRVKNMLDRAYRENPRAKSDVEALAGHMDTVDKINKKQDFDLAKSRKDYDELHKDLLDKEERFKAQDKRFKDFVDQVAQMDLTPPESARAAQDFEKGATNIDVAKYKKPKVGVNPNTGTPYGPTPSADVSKPADKTTAPAEPKAEPAQAPAPQPSAFPQMVSQLGNNEPGANDDLSDIDDQELPSNIVQLSKFRQPQQAQMDLEPERKFATEETDPIKHMAQDIMSRSEPVEKKRSFDHNTKAFMVAYIKGRPVKLKFGTAWVTLTSDEAITIYEYVMNMYRPADKAEAEFNLLLSDLNEFREIKQKVKEMQASLPLGETKNYWKKLQEERSKKLSGLVKELENVVAEGEVIQFPGGQRLEQAKRLLAGLDRLRKSNLKDPQLGQALSEIRSHLQALGYRIRGDGNDDYLIHTATNTRWKLDQNLQPVAVQEGLADEFMAMAKAKGMNPRLRGTPEQERERTQQMLAQRAKEREEQEKQSAQADTAKLPELKAEYEELKKKYDSLGGSNWQYADREQNLSDREREARNMEPMLNQLHARIARAESHGMGEGYPGYIQKGKELDAATKKIQTNLDRRIRGHELDAATKEIQKNLDKRIKQVDRGAVGDTFTAGQRVKVKGQTGKFVSYVNPMVAMVEFDSGYGSQQFKVPVKAIEQAETVVSEEGAEETVDDILYKLTYTYRRIQHANELADHIKDDSRTIYELLRNPLKNDDMGEYLRMRRYVQAKYPDAWDIFDEHTQELTQEDSWHGASDEWHGTGDLWHGGDSAGGAGPAGLPGVSRIPGLE